MKVDFKGKSVDVAPRFKWNKTPAQIEKDLGFTQSLNLFAANTAYKLMNDFVPMSSGALLQMVNITADGQSGYVEYLSPYAHFQYFGQLMVGPSGSAWAKFGETKHYVPQRLKYDTSTHPLATSYWDKAMMDARGDRYVRSVDEYRKRLAK